MRELRLAPHFDSSEPPSVTETHISVVSFVGDRVYKLKKPVDLGFLDFTDRAERARACHREVELNRRLAPDVYLGVADIGSADGPCDHLVVMRRMPADRRLSTLVRDPEHREFAGAAAERLADVIAEFHSQADRSDAIDAAATTSAVRGNWDQNFDQLEPFVGVDLDEQTCRRVETLAHRYLDGRDALFSSRIADGHVCDGHGDLQADDIFVLDDGPRVLDCVEFSDNLRHGDVLADVAFLAMDLERLGADELAGRFLSAYARSAGEVCPPTLTDHYIAYRAHVRAKVNCLLAHQSPDRAAEARATARRLIDLARTHLERGRIRMVMIGGLPGSGKSTVAARLAAENGWTQIRTDDVRAELLGADRRPDAPQPFDVGRYAPDVTQAVYARVRDLTEAALGNGESVVLDASWSDPARRADFRRLAHACRADVDELRCETTVEIAELRMRRRAIQGSDPSEATPAVAHEMAARFGPWPEALTVDTSGSVDDSYRRTVAALSADHDVPGPVP